MHYYLMLLVSYLEATYIINVILYIIVGLFHMCMTPGSSTNCMPFTGLETESLQKAYFKRNFNLLVCGTYE